MKGSERVLGAKWLNCSRLCRRGHKLDIRMGLVAITADPPATGSSLARIKVCAVCGEAASFATSLQHLLPAWHHSSCSTFECVGGSQTSLARERRPVGGSTCECYKSDRVSWGFSCVRWPLVEVSTRHKLLQFRLHHLRHNKVSLQRATNWQANDRKLVHK